jgi:hypothetical protein
MAKKLSIVTGAAVLTASISATTAAIITAAAAVAGAGVSAYSAYAAGENAEEAAKANEENAKARAKIALQNGAQEAAEKKDKARRIASQQAEGAAASGLRIDSGTPLALLTETAGLGEYDARVIRMNAERQAYGLRAEADIYGMQGRAAASAGKLNAAGTFLGGMANAVGSYYSMTEA